MENLQKNNRVGTIIRNPKVLESALLTTIRQKATSK